MKEVWFCIWRKPCVCGLFSLTGSRVSNRKRLHTLRSLGGGYGFSGSLFLPKPSPHQERLSSMRSIQEIASVQHNTSHNHNK